MIVADPSRRLVVLAVCCLGIFTASMDTTILNVALPSLGRELGSSVSGLQWTLDAYTLVLASFLLLAGSLGDRFGRRRVLQVGLAMFGLGSLLCSLAPAVEWLIVFRVIQALGGSVINPVAVSIITATFLVPAQRARAVGVWGAVAGLALAVGPILGGLLTEVAGWRSVFWINIPVVVAAIVLAGVFIPNTRADRARRFDVVGQLLIMGGLAGLVAGLIEGPNLGWGSPPVIGLFVVAVLATVAVILVEPRRRDPVLDLRFFSSAPFTAAVLSAVLNFVVFGSTLFLMTFYLQETRGLPPPTAGLYLLPMAITMMIASAVAGPLVTRVGSGILAAIVATAYLAGAMLLTGLTAQTAGIVILVSLGLFGIGFGMLNTVITHAAVSGMPKSQAGSAAGVTSSSRQVGVALGVALAGVATGDASGDGFARSTHGVWWLIMAIAVLILVLGLVAGSRWGASTTLRVAHLLLD